jgi:drug/metabolite transporter (DMT)-like permease
LGAWVTSLAGTPEGHRLAIALALVAAFLHALFGALQKGRDDPWLARAAIDASYGIMALPVALFLVPWPKLADVPIFLGVFVIHAGYKIAQAMTYDRAPYTFAYPIVRGTGPILTVVFAGMIFGEAFAPGQWLGLGLLVLGILGLAWQGGRGMVGTALWPALGLSVLTGGFVAAYTTYDAWGIRALPDPFTFLAWFFVTDSPFIPLLIARRFAGLERARIAGLIGRGIFGGLVAFASFGSVMIATRIGHVGLAAALRETSTVFAALIGRVVLGEKVGALRASLMGVIALGAVLMEILR